MKKARRKIRTREHIIEDLSINYFDRFALECGFSTQKIDNDYGYDLLLFSYSNIGEIESGSVRIQMKASDNLQFDKSGNIVFDVDTRDINLWVSEFDPVMLVTYDSVNRKSYWLDVQSYFSSVNLDKKKKHQGHFRVHIPKKNRINTRSIRYFTTMKNLRYDEDDLFS